MTFSVSKPQHRSYQTNRKPFIGTKQNMMRSASGTSSTLKPPSKLYRYRSMGAGLTDDDRLRPIFLNAKLYFPSRSQLNDPFECIVPSFSAKGVNTLKPMIRKGLKEDVAKGSNRAERRRLEKRILAPKVLDELRKATQDLVNRAGILSLSAVRDELLIWAHYSNGHRGICLEFDSETLNFSLPILPVAYFPTYQGFDATLPGPERTRRLVLSKYDGWSYEQEWRIVHATESGKAFGDHTFPPESLTGVIFGCACSDEDKEKVLAWSKSGPCSPRFYIAKAKEEEFGLKIEPLKG